MQVKILFHGLVVEDWGEDVYLLRSFLAVYPCATFHLLFLHEAGGLNLLWHSLWMLANSCLKRLAGLPLCFFWAWKHHLKMRRLKRKKHYLCNTSLAFQKRRWKGKWSFLMAFEIEMLIITFEIPLTSIGIPSFLPFLSVLTLHTREGMRVECIFSVGLSAFQITSNF